MTGRIIPLHGDEHAEVQLLLPWRATGKLDAPEQARVDAHLAGCGECRADLEFERRLRDDVAGLPVEADHAWARLRDRMDDRPRRSAGRARAWVGWAIAAQILVLAGAAGLLAPYLQEPRYQALSAAQPAIRANIIVMFRPETQERTLRRILGEVNARLVDGPTAADAYMLHVTPDQRDAAVATLRGQAEVLLAQPLDSDDR